MATRLPKDPGPARGGPAAGDPARPAELTAVDPWVVAERVGDSLVVVHLGTNRIHELNATAGRIFELLRSGRDRQAVVVQLLAEFEIDASTVERELDQLLDELRRRQITR